MFITQPYYTLEVYMRGGSEDAGSAEVRVVALAGRHNEGNTIQHRGMRRPRGKCLCLSLI